MTRTPTHREERAFRIHTKNLVKIRFLYGPEWTASVWAGQPRLSRSRATNLPEVSPEAVCQTQRAAKGECEISQEGPASAVWLGPPYSADRQFSVGDNVNLFFESRMR